MNNFSQITAEQFQAMAWPAGLCVHVDGTNGSDTKGARGTPRAFKTLTAAKNAAQSGDTVIVHPGTYAENNLLKNGVDWHFFPGAVIDYTNPDTQTGNARGIWDDRDTGAVACRISGAGVFKFNGGTAEFDPAPVYYIKNGTANLKGAIVLTQSASDVSIQCAELSGTSNYAFPAYVWLVYAPLCARLYIECDRMLDNGFATAVQVGVDGDTLPVLAPANLAGVYWEQGEVTIKVGILKATRYGIWGSRIVGSGAWNLWVTADQILNYGGENVVYFNDSGAATQADWRSWIIAKEISNINGGVGDGVGYYGGGKHYLVAQKVSAVSPFTFSGANGGAEAWIFVEKATAAVHSGGSPYHIDIQGSGTWKIHATIQEFEDGGNNTLAAINCANALATVFVTGHRARILNGKGIIHSAAGSVRVKGITFDTSNTNNANNRPVSVTAAGLILDGCVLVAPALADSIGGGTAVVKIYGTTFANKAKNASITTQVGTLTVDGNVS